MPRFTDDEQRTLAFARAWYRDHRGALAASTIADALGLPCSAVSEAAGVLAAAGAVRTHHSAHPHDGHRDALFLDAPPPLRRVVDLTAAEPFAAVRHRA
ncbi:hypothetical protein [Kineococcus sp. SYSU DK002]|uniref:hypothetical protein n=1 Tax=Kineococcus sp. SYSU DK002 TaxID=3383123 RepID=UPI003D7D3718